MTAPRDDLGSYLRALRRRLVRVRAIEAAGLGLLAACAVALIAIATRGLPAQNTTALAAIVLAAGAAGGATWALRRRPGMLAAATIADRQLGLGELLSTTCSLDDWERRDAAMAGAVRAMARQHIAALAGRRVVLRRLGARVWGGIGLASALVLILSLLVAHPLTTQADDASVRTWASGDSAAERGDEAHAVFSPPSPARRRGFAEPMDDRSLGGEASFAADEPSAPAAKTDPASAKTPGGSKQGSGGGMGLTDSPSNNGGRLDPSPSAAKGGPSAGNETAGTGAGQHAPGAPGRATGLHAGIGDGVAATPWSNPTWPADATAAHSAVRSGRVPDAYRSLVRAYFDRRP